MFAKHMGLAIAKVALAATVAVSTSVAATPTAQASGMTNAWMTCAEGTGAVGFNLPLDAPARYSAFGYYLDNVWQGTTNWYYSSHGSYQMLTQNGWESIYDGGGPIRLVGGNHVVDGFEYRWTAQSGGQWVSLGRCTTSSFFEGGIIFN